MDETSPAHCSPDRDGNSNYNHKSTMNQRCLSLSVSDLKSFLPSILHTLIWNCLYLYLYLYLMLCRIRVINSHCRDHNDDKIGNRRIVVTNGSYECDYFSSYCCISHLLGSSNGLVCIYNFRKEILVINPETREVNKLKNPQIPVVGYTIGGFGYDSSKDDYKVVLGFKQGNGFTSFQMLTSKSNIWKVIGEVNYTPVSRIGMLCNGALHWIACHDNQKVVLSFDLCDDKFKEIPQPDDMRYEYRLSMANSMSMHLGTMDDCLCVFYKYPYGIWVMNSYNVKQSWEFVGPGRKIKNDVVHRLKRLKYYIPNKRSVCHEEDWFVKTSKFLGALQYVPSLVSPHFCRKPKRKRLETGSTKSGKVSNANISGRGNKASEVIKEKSC